MSEARMRILKLLEQGRINSEEALALLKALEGTSVPPEVPEVGPIPVPVMRESPSLLEELGQELREIGEEITSEVEDALQEVRSAISQELGEGQSLADWLQGFLGGHWGTHYTWEEQRTVAIPDTVERLHLDISSKNGNLRLRASDDEHIAVQLRFRVQADSEAEARQLVEQYLLQNEEQKDGELQLAWRVSEEIRGSVSFDIAIPRRLLTQMDLVSKNGSISVEEVCGAGRAVTKNGSIKVRGQSHDDWQLETKNGSITVTAQVGSLLATSKNGSIRGVLEPTSDGTITLTTTNGSVQVELATGDARGYQLDLQTRSGRVSVDLPALVASVEDKQHYKASTENWQQAAIKTQVMAASKNGSISVLSRA